MTQKNNQNYYVNIVEPVYVRRNLLESSRSIIHILQGHEKLKEIREKKHELFNKYNFTIKEIKSLVMKIKSELPEVTQSKKRKIEKESKEKPFKVEKTIPKEKSALEALEQELLSIEDQLNNLSNKK